MKIPTPETHRFYTLAKDKAREAVKLERISRQLADLGLPVSSKEIYLEASTSWQEAIGAMSHVVWQDPE